MHKLWPIMLCSLSLLASASGTLLGSKNTARLREELAAAANRYTKITKSVCPLTSISLEFSPAADQYIRPISAPPMSGLGSRIRRLGSKDQKQKYQTALKEWEKTQDTALLEVEEDKVKEMLPLDYLVYCLRPTASVSDNETHHSVEIGPGGWKKERKGETDWGTATAICTRQGQIPGKSPNCQVECTNDKTSFARITAKMNSFRSLFQIHFARKRMLCQVLKG